MAEDMAKHLFQAGNQAAAGNGPNSTSFQRGRATWNKGKKGCFSKETREKMAAAKRGKPSASRGKPRTPSGNMLQVAHSFMKLNFGQPQSCQFCECEKDGPRTTKDGRDAYHWANISGEYKLDPLDWYRLCIKCHKNYDMQKLRARKLANGK